MLTGTIPESLGSLSRLAALFLSANELNGTLPAVLGNATFLQYVQLNDNDLSGTVPRSFQQLQSLGK